MGNEAKNNSEPLHEVKKEVTKDYEPLAESHEVKKEVKGDSEQQLLAESHEVKEAKKDEQQAIKSAGKFVAFYTIIVGAGFEILGLINLNTTNPFMSPKTAFIIGSIM